MPAPRSAAELRDLLLDPSPRLFHGRLEPLLLAEPPDGLQRLSLGELDTRLELHAADLRASVGVGVPLGEIEAAAAEAGLSFINQPLLDPRAGLYDLALSGALSRFTPGGGRLAGRVSGVWTPTPGSADEVLLGCRTAKGVAGYNLARTALLGSPPLPVTACEILLRPRLADPLAFERSFDDYPAARAFLKTSARELWSVPGLCGAELLVDDGGASLALLCGGPRRDEGQRALAESAFNPLEPDDWRERKSALRRRLETVRLRLSFEPPAEARLLLGEPLAGPWLYPGPGDLPPVNPVLGELWPAARLLPATTIV